MLFALSCWAFPISTAAQIQIPQSNTETKTEQVTTPTNESNQPIRTVEQGTRYSDSGLHLVSTPIKTAKEEVRSFSGRDYSKEEVQDLIVKYSVEYGNAPVAPLALRIAQCESGFNQYAKNKSSTASGVYQWLSSSWRSQPASEGGTVSVFDAEANIKAAVWLIANGKTSPWNASRSCWNH